jgi:hypothetical protein
MMGRVGDWGKQAGSGDVDTIPGCVAAESRVKPYVLGHARQPGHGQGHAKASV